MSVFGGDSWAREAHNRKRRVDDLLLSSTSTSSSAYKRLPSGRFACLICPNNPVVDSPLMLSVHAKGARHVAAEARAKQREAAMRVEKEKRIALEEASTGNPISLVEETSRKPVEGPSGAVSDKVKEDKDAVEDVRGDNGDVERREEDRQRREKELKFVAAGWKRDGYGKWYRDDNAEFDSDEDDPNDYFTKK